MSTRAITGIISFCIAMTGIFLANMFLMMMIGEINRKRPDGNLVSYFGFAPLKVIRIFGEYRGLYPNGRMHMYSFAAIACTMIGLASTAVCFRIIG
jgi:hypothetical protein